MPFLLYLLRVFDEDGTSWSSIIAYHIIMSMIILFYSLKNLN